MEGFATREDERMHTDKKRDQAAQTVGFAKGALRAHLVKHFSEI